MNSNMARPIGKTGFFQAGTLSSISSSIPLTAPLIVTDEPMVDFEAWTRSASNHNWASSGMTCHTSIDEPLNGAEPGEYDIYLDLVSGAFTAVNSQTKKNYTWICKLCFSEKPEIYEEIFDETEVKAELKQAEELAAENIQTGCCILDEDFDIVDQEHKQAILASNAESSSPESIMENRWYEDKLGIVKVVENTIAQAIDSPYSDERVQRERIYTLNALLQHISTRTLFGADCEVYEAPDVTPLVAHLTASQKTPQKTSRKTKRKIDSKQAQTEDEILRDIDDAVSESLRQFEEKHVCNGTNKGPPKKVCKNHTKCHKKGYQVYDDNEAFLLTPPEFIKTIQVSPPIPAGTEHCEKCEWDGVCSLTFLCNSFSNSIMVEDALGNSFRIPCGAVGAYELKEDSELEDALKTSLYLNMRNQSTSILRDFGYDKKTIQKFNTAREERFRKAVKKMIRSYKAINELADLINPESSWIRKYMGKIFRDIDFENECIRGKKSTKPAKYIEENGYKYKLDSTG